VCAPYALSCILQGTSDQIVLEWTVDVTGTTFGLLKPLPLSGPCRSMHRPL
jgi:hypothetical protein